MRKVFMFLLLIIVPLMFGCIKGFSISPNYEDRFITLIASSDKNIGFSLNDIINANILTSSQTNELKIKFNEAKGAVYIRFFLACKDNIEFFMLCFTGESALSCYGTMKVISKIFPFSRIFQDASIASLIPISELFGERMFVQKSEFIDGKTYLLLCYKGIEDSPDIFFKTLVI